MKKKSLISLGCILCLLLIVSLINQEAFSEDSLGEVTESPKLIFGDESSKKSFKDGEYQGEGMGKNGPVLVEIRIKDGFMDRIDVLEHNENVAVAEGAFDTLSKEMIKDQTSEVDTVAGATLSSRAFKDGVRDALQKARIN